MMSALRPWPFASPGSKAAALLPGEAKGHGLKADIMGPPPSTPRRPMQVAVA